MNNQCLPVGKMSKMAAKVLAEANELKNREIDLVDKNISSFDELPGICEYFFLVDFIMTKYGFGCQYEFIQFCMKKNICYFGIR
jgi:hypothetical protein